ARALTATTTRSPARSRRAPRSRPGMHIHRCIRAAAVFSCLFGRRLQRMRVPTDLPSRMHPGRRYQAWIVGAVVFVIVALIVIQGLANFYTDYLWYRSVNFTSVWRLLIETKLELAAVFIGAFFIACWVSLWVVDRIAPRALLVSPELEIVRRYQQIVGRHTFALRTV